MFVCQSPVIHLHFQKKTNVVYHIYINYVNVFMQILYKGVTKVYIEKTEKKYILVYQPYHTCMNCLQITDFDWSLW